MDDSFRKMFLEQDRLLRELGGVNSIAASILESSDLRLFQEQNSVQRQVLEGVSNAAAMMRESSSVKTLAENALGSISASFLEQHQSFMPHLVREERLARSALEHLSNDILGVTASSEVQGIAKALSDSSVLSSAVQSIEASVLGASLFEDREFINAVAGLKNLPSHRDPEDFEEEDSDDEDIHDAEVKADYSELSAKSAEIKAEIITASKTDNDFELLSQSAREYLALIISIISLVLTFIQAVYPDEIREWFRDEKQPEIQAAHTVQIQNSKIRACLGMPSYCRVVSTRDDPLTVRAKPKTASEEVGELPTGTLIFLQEPGRDASRSWLYVEGETAEGEIITGWVYRRYTTPFPK